MDEQSIANSYHQAPTKRVSQLVRGCLNLTKYLEFEQPENATALKLGRKSFAVHCDPIWLESGLVGICGLVFGHRMFIYQKRNNKFIGGRDDLYVFESLEILLSFKKRKRKKCITCKVLKCFVHFNQLFI